MARAMPAWKPAAVAMKSPENSARYVFVAVLELRSA
jgi:hypothetical protein